MRFRLLLALPLPAVLFACPPSGDYTPQIRVADGVKNRMDLLGHIRSRDAGVAGKPLPPARAHTLAKGDELGGPNAIGRIDDIVLENEEVVFVIDQLGHSNGFAESGGNLVDAADARVRKDELGQLFTYFGTFPRQGIYGRITSGVTPGGAAWAEATGHGLYEPNLDVTTRYTLSPGDRALLLETTLTNHSDHAIEKLGLGDAIQWGGAEKFAPGKPIGFKGKSSGPFIGGIGRFTSYGITSTEGEMSGVSGGSWTDTEQAKVPSLKPGDSAKYARVFVVGERGDAASVISELTRASDGPVGAIEVSLIEDGHPAKVLPGAKAILATTGGQDVMSLIAMGPGDTFGGEVPPGKYVIRYAGGAGRRGSGAKALIDVVADKVARAELVVSAGGSLAFTCVELVVGDDGHQNRVAGPCKVTLEGVAGTPNPELGPGHVSGPAKNQITTADGAVDVPLSPGKYRVTLSRGPEYGIVQWEQEVLAGTPTVVPPTDAMLLTRVLDTSGYVATDFHQHSMLGADSPVGLRDRVIANAAEGVEVAVATEHNVIADLEPLVKDLGLGARLVEISGDELTTDTSKKPWGHANVFPLAVDKTKARGGAPDVRDRSAERLFAELRAIKEPHVLQINHPRTGITGYFDQLHFDPLTGIGTDPDYDPAFDALEVWNGRNVDGRDRVLQDFFALLRTKHPVTATADTDTHGIVGQEAGYPRTYVRVTDDKHLGEWNALRTTDMVKGVRERRDVVLTNGPFLRVTANGAPIGGIAKLPRGIGPAKRVKVKVHVECTPWAKIESVTLKKQFIGIVKSAYADPTEEVHLQPLPSGALAADVVFDVDIWQDDAIVIIAQGSQPMTPVLSGDPKEITPYAMTGAIWVDYDGDGKSLGR